MKTRVQAEHHTAKTVIMHTPGNELFWGCLQNEAALFEKEPFDRYRLRDEQNHYIKTLEDQGVEVLLVRDVLLEGTMDQDGYARPGRPLEDLIELAERSLTYDYPEEFSPDQVLDAERYRLKTLKAMNPKDLVRIVLLQPTVRLRSCDEGNTGLIVRPYELNPTMNLHFLRDQQITTDKGIVIGRMNSSQRSHETAITQEVFRKLGAHIVYEVQGDGRLEGGDFIPMGDYALIGQGLRTNEEGIRQLLDNDALGYTEVAVVKDSWKDQEEMHLDTYFNIAGRDRAVLLEDRMGYRDEDGTYCFNDPRKATFVDVYAKNKDGSYKKIEQDIPFDEYLAGKGLSVQQGSMIPITKQEQLSYGCNMLCLSDRKIVAMADLGDEEVTRAYHAKLEQAGIEIVKVDLGTFVKTYGAPHCATQVISREQDSRSRLVSSSETGGCPHAA